MLGLVTVAAAAAAAATLNVWFAVLTMDAAVNLVSFLVSTSSSLLYDGFIIFFRYHLFFGDKLIHIDCEG